MALELPIVLRVHPALLAHHNPWAVLLARAGVGSALAAGCYGFRCDEKPFARELLRARPNLWLYRCHQRRFCGDFERNCGPGVLPRTASQASIARSAPLASGGPRHGGISALESASHGRRAQGHPVGRPRRARGARRAAPTSAPRSRATP